MPEAIYIFGGIIVFLISIVLIYKKQNKFQSSLLTQTNGFFKHNKADGITCILSGIFLIGLFVFISFKDQNATLPDLLVGCGLGTLFALIGVGFLLFNFKAFFHINNGHIKGKYHYLGKIDCNINDVDFALGINKTLVIQLKDGKTYTIMGIENAWQLASTIRHNMTLDLNEHPESLIKKLETAKSARKKSIIYVCLGVILIFTNIFVTVFLTGERDLSEFGKIDWIIFAVMGAIELSLIIFTFYFAQKAVKSDIPIEKMQYVIRRRIVETKPLFPGNVMKVFADANFSGRLTLFGYPNQDSVYYVVEKFASDFTLSKSYESEIFENIEYIQGSFEELIDITQKLLHS